MWQMASENSLIRQATNMRVSGRITWPMAEDKLFTVMKVNTMENL
jgi:hypothetical protein